MTDIRTDTKESLTHSNNALALTNPNHPLWQQGAAIEASVFIEADYVESQDELALEYEKYLPKTEFIVAQKDGEAGGSVRAIFFDPEVGFKTLDDISAGKLVVSEEGREALESLDLEDTFEVGTLAVQKKFRGKPDDEGRLAVALYGAIYAESTRHDCRYVLASFDEGYFDNFKAIFGPAVKALGPATPYMGSPTVPALLDIPELFEYIGQGLPEVQDEIRSVALEMQHE